MKLRPRLVALILGAGAAPLAWVGAVAAVEDRQAAGLQARVEAGVAAVSAGEDPTAVASAHQVQVRVEAGARTLVWAEPGGRPSGAGEVGAEPLDGCRPEGALLVCGALRDLGDGRRLRVDASAPRPLRALGRDPVALVQLLLASAGLVAGWGWLAGRGVWAAAARLEASRRGAEERIRSLEARLADSEGRRAALVGASRDARRAAEGVRDALRRGPGEPTDAGTRSPALADQLDRLALSLEAEATRAERPSAG